MASMSEIRKGVVIKHQGDLFLVTSFRFTNPGKGSPFTTAKLKSITREKTVEMTYKAVDNIDIVEVQNQKLQYLYKTGNVYSFMDNSTYEIHELNESVLGDDVKYLKEGMEVHGIIYEESIVAINLPPKIQYKVVDAPPAVKGDTASSGRLMKDVTLENGLIVRAPIFIRPDDILLISTDDASYCERINE